MSGDDTAPPLDTIAVVYGYLWHMPIDLRTKDGRCKHDARVLLRSLLSKQMQAWGIDEVKQILEAP